LRERVARHGRLVEFALLIADTPLGHRLGPLRAVRCVLKQ
jgi:hypothetical protein